MLCCRSWPILPAGASPRAEVEGVDTGAIKAALYLLGTSIEQSGNADVRVAVDEDMFECGAEEFG